MLSLSPEGTHPKELPGGHGHYRLEASTPTMDPGVEEYERLVEGKPVTSVTLAGQMLHCLLDSGSQGSFVRGVFQTLHKIQDVGIFLNNS